MTVVIKDTGGLPLERWIFDLGYLAIAEGREREAGYVSEPSQEDKGVRGVG